MRRWWEGVRDLETAGMDLKSRLYYKYVFLRSEPTPEHRFMDPLSLHPHPNLISLKKNHLPNYPPAILILRVTPWLEPQEDEAAHWGCFWKPQNNRPDLPTILISSKYFSRFYPLFIPAPHLSSPSSTPPFGTVPNSKRPARLNCTAWRADKFDKRPIIWHNSARHDPYSPIRVFLHVTIYASVFKTHPLFRN